MPDQKPSQSVAKPTPVQLAARRHGYEDGQIDAIRKTVAKDCSEAELVVFLELAARYQLDPFTGEIYAVKMGGRDGAGGSVTIMTSRDGYLSHANRRTDFQGMEGDVVRKNDSFKKSQAGVEHSYEGDTNARGEIVGAWALVHREGRKPTFFFAPFGEYSGQNKVWKTYPSAMILKCAESMALRKAFSISGFTPEEEVSGGHQVVEAEEAVDWGTDPELALWLSRLAGTLNQTAPGTVPDAYLRLELNGKSQEEKRQFALALVDRIEALGLTPPEPLEQPTVAFRAVQPSG